MNKESFDLNTGLCYMEEVRECGHTNTLFFYKAMSSWEQVCDCLQISVCVYTDILAPDLARRLVWLTFTRRSQCVTLSRS